MAGKTQPSVRRSPGSTQAQGIVASRESAASAWGEPAKKSGIRTEVKLALVLIITLVGAFGYIVHRKFDALRKHVLAAETKPGEDFKPLVSEADPRSEIVFPPAEQSEPPTSGDTGAPAVASSDPWIESGAPDAATASAPPLLAVQQEPPAPASSDAAPAMPEVNAPRQQTAAAESPADPFPVLAPDETPSTAALPAQSEPATDDPPFSLFDSAASDATAPPDAASTASSASPAFMPASPAGEETAPGSEATEDALPFAEAAVPSPPAGEVVASDASVTDVAAGDPFSSATIAESPADPPALTESALPPLAPRTTTTPTEPAFTPTIEPAFPPTGDAIPLASDAAASAALGEPATVPVNDAASLPTTPASSSEDRPLIAAGVPEPQPLLFEPVEIQPATAPVETDPFAGPSIIPQPAARSESPRDAREALVSETPTPLEPAGPEPNWATQPTPEPASVPLEASPTWSEPVLRPAQEPRLLNEPVIRPQHGGAAPAVFQPGDSPSTVYTIRSGDTYWSIAREHYGSVRYFAALTEFNRQRIPKPQQMRPGMQIEIPDPAVLEQRYPNLLGAAGANPESRPANPESRPAEPASGPGRFFVQEGQPAYRIGQGDTLSSIAQKHLGRASRWEQIYAMNRDVLPSPDRLKLGTVLRLPHDASQIALTPDAGPRR